MKKSLILTAIVLAISCTNAQKTQFSKEALAEKLVTIDGQSATFGDIIKNYSGKSLLIEVWASWCSDCVKAMPKIKEIQAANKDVVYMFVSMDKTQDAWKAGITKHDLTGNHFFAPDGMKGAFGKAVDLDWIPRYIILDKSGNVVTYRATEKNFDEIGNTLKNLQQ
jgi:thiol-disulfide isomerase/thioredoxin